MQEVTELYTDVKLPAEVIAWGNLAMILGAAIGPRLYMTSERLKKKAMRDVTPRPAAVAPVPTAPPAAAQAFATPGFEGPLFPEVKPDPRPQATSPPTGADLNKALFPDEFKF